MYFINNWPKILTRVKKYETFYFIIPDSIYFLCDYK